jgi:hypothetical protein
MTEVLSGISCVIGPKTIAIITTITRLRCNPEPVVTVETISGTKKYIKKETAKMLQSVSADKKVVITTIKKQQVNTMVYNASL